MKLLLEKTVSSLDKIRLNRLSKSFINIISRQNYAHNLNWCGIQIYQTPTDLFLYQQLIFRARPNVIVETGVAKGGSVLFACQMLETLHKNLGRNSWKIICCDVNSLDYAKQVITRFGYSENVFFFQGDSASLAFQSEVREQLKGMNETRVLISLDSNHTESHVLDELKSLAEFVSINSFAVIWDSRIGDLSRLTHYLRPRAWNKRQHAGSAVTAFLNTESFASFFESCREIEDSLLITGTKNGVLLRRR